jgi:hypothetical protein
MAKRVESREYRNLTPQEESIFVESLLDVTYACRKSRQSSTTLETKKFGKLDASKHSNSSDINFSCFGLNYADFLSSKKYFTSSGCLSNIFNKVLIAGIGLISPRS